MISSFRPSTPRNLIARVLTIYHVKITIVVVRSPYPSVITSVNKKKRPLFSHAFVLCKVMMERDFRNWDWDLIGSTLQVMLVLFTRKLILF